MNDPREPFELLAFPDHDREAQPIYQIRRLSVGEQQALNRFLAKHTSAESEMAKFALEQVFDLMRFGLHSVTFPADYPAPAYATTLVSVPWWRPKIDAPADEILEAIPNDHRMAIALAVITGPEDPFRPK